MPSKIKLDELPELQGHVIIQDQRALQNFLQGLRQDYYSPKKIRSFDFVELFDVWLAARKPNMETFYAVLDEPDDHAKNDGLGHADLLQCLAIKTRDGKVHVFKMQIHRFEH